MTDYLRENLFSGTPLDRNAQEHRVSVVRAIRARSPSLRGWMRGWNLNRYRRTAYHIGNFVKLDGGRSVQAATDGVVHLNANELTILLRMAPGPLGFSERLSPERLHLQPKVSVYLDFQHNHMDGVRFTVPRIGKAVGRRVWACEGTLASRVESGEGSGIRKGWNVESGHAGGVWFVRLAIDLDHFGIREAAHPVVGFCVVRMHDLEGHAEETSWPASRVWKPIPSTYGHLILTDAPLIVRSLDLRHPIHGLNRTVVEVANTSSKPVAALFRAATTAPSLQARHDVRRTLAPRSVSRVTLPYETSVLDWADQVVTFTVEAEGRLAHSASYRAGSCFGRMSGGTYLQLKHRLPYNIPHGRPAPKAGDRDYYRAKRLHLLSNMPDFVRDERDPFRFILGKRSGRVVVRFDLSRQGVFRRIGRYIERLFDTDDDRILAAMFLVHQACTWDPTFRPICAVSNPLSLFRIGYILCGDYVYVLAAVLRSMTERRTGRPFTAHYCCASNHIICAIDRGRDHVLIDPNLGFFFPGADDRRLATADELRQNPDLVRRVAPGRMKDYLLSERVFLARTMLNFPPRAASG